METRRRARAAAEFLKEAGAGRAKDTAFYNAGTAALEAGRLDVARGALALPPEHDAEALYAATQEMLDAAGLPAYEVSNHARSGGECRHNLAYWRYQDYIGVGPGAHGRLVLSGAVEVIGRIIASMTCSTA